MANLSAFLFGSPGESIQMERFTPEQRQALNQILQTVLPALTEEDLSFEPIEQRAREQFEQKTIPTIAERFTAMGGQQSGAFRRALGESGAGLESQLASLRSQYGLSRAQLMANLANLALTPQFESIYQPETKGFLRGMAPRFAQSALSALPSWLSGSLNRSVGSTALGTAKNALGAGGATGTLGTTSQVIPGTATPTMTGGAAPVASSIAKGGLNSIGAGVGAYSLINWLNKRRNKRRRMGTARGFGGR